MEKSKKELTAFGKELRKFRAAIPINLSDMAKDLQVSRSFVSAVELGVATIPKDYMDRLSSFYGERTEWKELEESLYDAVDKTADRIVLCCNLNPKKREYVRFLYEVWNDLSDRELDYLIETSKIIRERRSQKEVCKIRRERRVQNV